MAAKKVGFSGALGSRLAGLLEHPADGSARGTALFAHCFTCTKDIFSARHLTRGLLARGFAVLRFDFTGLGASEGEFADTNFSTTVQDLRCAADFLRRECEAPALIVGHSLGGTAALAAAAGIPELRAVATVAAPADPSHLRHLFDGKQEDMAQRGEAEVLVDGRPFRFKKQFLDDIAQTGMPEKIAGMGKALLILHAANDAVVDIAHARKIYEAARHPKSFICLDGADHLLLDAADGLYASDMLAAWAQRYLPR